MARGDDGAYLVLWAMLATAVFAVAALVLDIATLRQDRRTDRLASDVAASAAVAELDPTDPTTVSTACRAAWDYVRLNLPGDTASPAAPPCTTTFPSTQPCTAALGARTAVGTVGDLRVEITHPVPSASPLMRAETPGGDRTQTLNPAADGTSCERIGVRLVRQRTFAFGGVVGQPGGGTDVHSVGRASSVPTVEVPGVVALHPTDCTTVSGLEGGGLAVAGVGGPGIIEVDSDGSTCGAEPYVIVANPGDVRAQPSGGPGRIRSYAMLPNPTKAFNPADVAAGRLNPQPTATADRFGRTPVEYRYNCSAVVNCPGVPSIDELEALLEGPGAPGGYSTYAGPCDVTTDTVLDYGSWFVDCPTLTIGARFAIRGGTTAFQGTVQVLPGGCFSVNSARCLPPGDPTGATPQDNVVFVRTGSLVKDAGGDIALNRSFVYLDDTAAGMGAVDMSPDESGSRELSWTAPNGGLFEDLALWTEGTGTIDLGGHGTFRLEGVYYAPNALIRLKARTGGSTADAQFIGAKVRAAGNPPFTVAPVAGRALARTVREVRLIR